MKKLLKIYPYSAFPAKVLESLASCTFKCGNKLYLYEVELDADKKEMRVYMVDV